MMFDGAQLILRERIRQMLDEGWSEQHDTQHDHDELVLAAVQYALPEHRRSFNGMDRVPTDWPWGDAAWKPSTPNRVRELTKAGALIAAEIDRLLAQGER